MMLEFSLYPVGSGESLSDAVAEAIKVVKSSGLSYKVHDMGTIIEGESPQCFEVVRNCIDVISRKHNRVACYIKIDYRKGKGARLGKKAEKVILLAEGKSRK